MTKAERKLLFATARVVIGLLNGMADAVSAQTTAEAARNVARTRTSVKYLRDLMRDVEKESGG